MMEDDGKDAAGPSAVSLDAERIGLQRAFKLFPADVAAARRMAEINRALLDKGLPPQLEPWLPTAETPT